MSSESPENLLKKARANLIRTLSKDIYSGWQGREEAILKAQEEFDLATAYCERKKHPVVSGRGIDVVNGEMREFEKRIR